MCYKKLVSMFIMAIISGFLAIPASATDEIQAASWLPPNHTASVYCFKYYSERAEYYSKGSLNVKVDLGSAMLTPRGAMQALADGIVDVAVHTGQYTPSELNVSAALEELAMLYTDPFITVAAAGDFEMNDPMMKEQWKRNGVVYGGPLITGSYNLLCNKDVSSLDQIKGRKIRLPGRSPATWATGVGVVPVGVSSNEQYSALDKGALDCTTAALTDMRDRKLYEVGKHVTKMPITIYWAGYSWAYNPKTWKGLTVEQRRALFNAQADALARYVVKGIIEGNQNAETFLKSEGVTFHDPDADLVESLNNYKLKLTVEAANVAKKKFRIDDPQALYARFKASIAKWTKLLSDMPRNDEKAFAQILRKEIFDKVDLSKHGVN